MYLVSTGDANVHKSAKARSEGWTTAANDLLNHRIKIATIPPLLQNSTLPTIHFCKKHDSQGDCRTSLDTT
ncbi:unnamed protein product [Calypogeia fissa]